MMSKFVQLTCFIICITLLSLFGCANVIDQSLKKSDFPPVGEIITVELGTQLLVQQNALISYGRKINKVTKFDSFYFFGVYYSMNNSEKYCGERFLNENMKQKSNIPRCLTDKDFKSAMIPYEESEIIVQMPTNFQRVLEYAGKSANTISLYYKEFNDVFIKPAFTQEFKFDLSDSKVIGIKGARIEVIEANNTGITYKVIAHFPR